MLSRVVVQYLQKCSQILWTSCSSSGLKNVTARSGKRCQGQSPEKTKTTTPLEKNETSCVCLHVCISFNPPKPQQSKNYCVCMFTHFRDASQGASRAKPRLARCCAAWALTSSSLAMLSATGTASAAAALLVMSSVQVCTERSEERERKY